MVEDTKIEEKKPKNLKELLGQDGNEDDDARLFAELIDSETGDLKVDLSLPEDYELEVVAKQLLDHLAAYAQGKQAWRAARNTGDHTRAKQLFDQMQYSRLTAAIIQHDYPKAKALADKLGGMLAKQTAANRAAQMAKDAE